MAKNFSLKAVTTPYIVYSALEISFDQGSSVWLPVIVGIVLVPVSQSCVQSYLRSRS